MREGYKESPIGEIPKDWSVNKLGKVADTFAGGTPKRGIAGYYNGTIPWIKSGEVNNNCIESCEEYITELALSDSSAKLIEPNSILVALYGATAGKVGVLKVSACSNQAVLAINSKQVNVSNNFLYHYLKRCTSELLNLCQGSGQPNLSKGIVESVQIPIPPLPEQQKIAEILSMVDEKIDVIDQQINVTQALKKGLMQRLLTKGIGHTEFKDSPLGEIPMSWEVVKFEDILRDGKGSLGYGILQPDEGDLNGINMVRTVDLTEVGRANTEIFKVTQKISNTSPTTVLEGGEVLLSVMGTLGRTFVVPKEWKGWNVNRALAVIRTNEKIDNNFLCQFFRSPYFKRVIVKQSLGSAQMRINLSDLRKYDVPLPSIKEQIEISTNLSLVDEKLGVLAEKKANYEGLKQGLMQQLLTGKIRVNGLINKPTMA